MKVAGSCGGRAAKQAGQPRAAGADGRAPRVPLQKRFTLLQACVLMPPQVAALRAGFIASRGLRERRPRNTTAATPQTRCGGARPAKPTRFSRFPVWWRPPAAGTAGAAAALRARLSTSSGKKAPTIP
jgi:hypothetical protein